MLLKNCFLNILNYWNWEMYLPSLLLVIENKQKKESESCATNVCYNDTVLF